MKFTIKDKSLVISVNVGLIIDQVITTAIAIAFVGGIFWYVPEQMGW